MTLETIRFWVAIVMLVDGSVGLLAEHVLQRSVPRVSVRRIALVEVFGALFLLCVHFLLGATG